MAKGHKACSQCGADNGARALSCGSCHQPFDIGAANEVFFFPITGNNIITPAGKCPVPWKGDLVAWVEAVRDTAPNDHFTDAALRYWLRTVVPANEFTNLATELSPLQTSML